MSEWRAMAACRGQGPALFFSYDEDDLAAARAVCKPCPVKAQCREDGKGKPGVWGGKTLAERTGTKTHKPPARAQSRNPYLLPKRPCDVCGAPFWPYSANARFCPDCRALGLGRPA